MCIANQTYSAWKYTGLAPHQTKTPDAWVRESEVVCRKVTHLLLDEEDDDVKEDDSDGEVLGLVTVLGLMEQQAQWRQN